MGPVIAGLVTLPFCVAAILNRPKHILTKKYRCLNVRKKSLLYQCFILELAQLSIVFFNLPHR